jgi:hypothetical protein
MLPLAREAAAPPPCGGARNGSECSSGASLPAAGRSRASGPARSMAIAWNEADRTQRAAHYAGRAGLEQALIHNPAAFGRKILRVGSLAPGGPDAVGAVPALPSIRASCLTRKRAIHGALDAAPPHPRPASHPGIPRFCTVTSASSQLVSTAHPGTGESRVSKAALSATPCPASTRDGGHRGRGCTRR